MLQTSGCVDVVSTSVTVACAGPPPLVCVYVADVCTETSQSNSSNCINTTRRLCNFLMFLCMTIARIISLTVDILRKNYIAG